MTKDIVKRKLQRTAFCRGCDKEMKSQTDVIATYSFRNRGQHIYFCLDCAKLIGKLSVENKIEVKQNPLIWGDGWYAMLIGNIDPDDTIWYVSPKKFFEENGYCPDGWEWEKPEEIKEMDEDEFEEFIDQNGCEPNAPNGFQYCIESGMSGDENWTLEEQKNKLREAGFIVDNVPKWHFERN